MALRFGGRLVVVIIFFLITLLPVGTIIMGVSCKGTGKIDLIDWILSLFVPFYGLIVSFVCQ